MKLEIGMQGSLTRTITDEDVQKMADLVSDHNPVHLDDEYAKGTLFGRRIVHGVFCNGLISAVLGNVLPGPGTIYLEQSLRWIRPVDIGDTITAEVMVDKLLNTKVGLQTKCWNQDGKLVAEKPLAKIPTMIDALTKQLAG